jgi:serine/threonine protein kinase
MASLASGAGSNGPLHQGWIHKQGHFIPNWKNRFFVLQMANEGSVKCFRLLYYKEQANYEDTPPTGAITVLGATVVKTDAPAGFFGFTVTTAKKKAYPMRVQSEMDRETWLQRIRLAMDADSAPNMSISGPSASGRPAAGGGADRRGSVKPMRLNTSVAVTDFDLLKVVGKGAFGKVFLVKKREGDDSEKLYAMKVLDKEVITQKGQVAHTKSERDIMHEIQHPYIVMLHYAFQSERKLYMITDYYPGGNLFAHVQRARRTGGFEEIRARFYSAELCLALDFLHQNGIVYRDLKLENILMDMKGHIVLTDFGLSKDNVADVTEATLQTFCGTVEYMAPELVKGQKYSVAVDWWSFGILVYEMMCTRTPFFHQKGRKAIFQGIIKADPQFPMHFSASSQDVISKLLAKEPTERLGMLAGRAADIQGHPWFADLDWDLLSKRELPPPWTPDVKDAMDFKYVPKRLQVADARDSEIEDGTGAEEVSAANKWDEFTFVQKSKLDV